jgi:hypothetical protein
VGQILTLAALSAKATLFIEISKLLSAIAQVLQIRIVLILLHLNCKTPALKTKPVLMEVVVMLYVRQTQIAELIAM